MTTSAGLDTEFVDAIHRSRLSTWAREALARADSDDPTRRLAEHAGRTCERIRSANEAERSRLLDAFDAASVTASVSVSDQRHTLTADVAPTDARASVAVLSRAGYRRSRIWARGAERSFWRHAGSVPMTRSADATTVVRLRWHTTPSRPVMRLLTPTAADWETVALPLWAWWAYPAVRPIRLLLERVGVRSRDHGDLEPFLVTPIGLIDPLLDVAGVNSDDVLFDFGCGDGRFLVAAASSRRCRAIGAERSAELAAAAAARVTDAGLDEAVRVIHGDAATVDLSDVTAVVLFLPTVVAARVVPDLLARLPEGARVVLHEQSPLTDRLPPADSVVGIVADDAVTVAHRWDVRRRP